MFSLEAEEAMRDHALSAFPREACGVVVNGGYVRQENLAEDPLNNFRLPDPAVLAAEAVIHSHIAPRHSQWPTAADMRTQIAMAVPFSIVTTDGEVASEPLWWGDFVLDEPLVGRDFAPGIRDCYALARAWWWQMHGTRLKDIPRSNEWWTFGLDLFGANFEDVGFVQVNDLRPGDLALMKVNNKIENHCAIVLPNGLILHHLIDRLSRQEPLGPWTKKITRALRYVG